MVQRVRMDRIIIEPLLLIVTAGAFLIIPWRWALAWFAATGVHELFHYIAIRICRAKIWQIHVGMSGVIIKTDTMLPQQELLCAIAGPVGSGFMLMFLRVFPEIAICGCFQCVFNLLPVYPNDGGRVIKAVLDNCFEPETAVKAVFLVNHAVFLLLLVFGIYIWIRFSTGLLPVLCVLLLWLKTKKSLH